MAIQGGLFNFKLDSGADVTIIEEATFNHMLKLKPVYTKLTSPGGQLTCLGQFVARSIIDGQPLILLRDNATPYSVNSTVTSGCSGTATHGGQWNY